MSTGQSLWLQQQSLVYTSLEVYTIQARLSTEARLRLGQKLYSCETCRSSSSEWWEKPKLFNQMASGALAGLDINGEPENNTGIWMPTIIPVTYTLSGNNYRLTPMVMNTFKRLVLAHLKGFIEPWLDRLHSADQSYNSVDDTGNMRVHYLLHQLDFSKCSPLGFMLGSYPLAFCLPRQYWVPLSSPAPGGTPLWGMMGSCLWTSSQH